MKIQNKTATLSRILTSDAIERPVAAYVYWTIGQLEGKGSSVRGQVGVAGCDVDGVWIWPLTHFHLGGEHVRCIVIYVLQVQLKGARPAGRRDTWTHTMKMFNTLLLFLLYFLFNSDNSQYISGTRYS